MVIRHVRPVSEWTSAWLDSVVLEKNSMTQRKLTSIDARGGGLDALRTAAEERGVHLLLVEDENGEQIVAASAKPFIVLC